MEKTPANRFYSGFNAFLELTKEGNGYRFKWTRGNSVVSSGWARGTQKDGVEEAVQAMRELENRRTEFDSAT